MQRLGKHSGAGATKIGGVEKKKKTMDDEGEVLTVLSPSYVYKWFIGLPNAYKLGDSKSLTAHEETTAGDETQGDKCTKLKIDVQLLPDYTEPSNERATKMSVALTVENAELDQYKWTAVLNTSLYNRQARDLILESQEEWSFAGRNMVKFMTTLGPQERIEKSANQCLEVGIKVKLQLRRKNEIEMMFGFGF